MKFRCSEVLMAGERGWSVCFERKGPEANVNEGVIMSTDEVLVGTDEVLVLATGDIEQPPNTMAIRITAIRIMRKIDVLKYPKDIFVSVKC